MTINEVFSTFTPEEILSNLPSHTFNLSDFQSAGLLGHQAIDEMIEILESNGYVVTDDNHYSRPENEIVEEIKSICRKINPNGYIDKEKAKGIICDYIDNWMIKSF